MAMHLPQVALHSSAHLDVSNQKDRLLFTAKQSLSGNIYRGGSKNFRANTYKVTCRLICQLIRLKIVLPPSLPHPGRPNRNCSETRCDAMPRDAWSRSRLGEVSAGNTIRKFGQKFSMTKSKKKRCLWSDAACAVRCDAWPRDRDFWGGLCRKIGSKFRPKNFDDIIEKKGDVVGRRSARCDAISRLSERSLPEMWFEIPAEIFR